MKKMLLLISIIYVGVGYSQSEDPNTIIVTLNKDKMQIMADVLDAIESEGYEAESIDKDFGRIKTKIIERNTVYVAEEGPYKFRYFFRVKDNQCEIRGEFFLEYNQKWWPGYNYGGLPRATWKEMEKFANRLNGKVSYMHK